MAVEQLGDAAADGQSQAHGEVLEAGARQQLGRAGDDGLRVAEQALVFVAGLGAVVGGQVDGLPGLFVEADVGQGRMIVTEAGADGVAGVDHAIFLLGGGDQSAFGEAGEQPLEPGAGVGFSLWPGGQMLQLGHELGENLTEPEVRLGHGRLDEEGLETEDLGGGASTSCRSYI